VLWLDERSGHVHGQHEWSSLNFVQVFELNPGCAFRIYKCAVTAFLIYKKELPIVVLQVKMLS
jgi:hypothetical protein